MEFIDLPMAWEEFMEQLQAGGWEPAFTTTQRWFAIKEETGASMTLSTDQLEKCTRVRGSIAFLHGSHG
jgi:hypothetical protein